MMNRLFLTLFLMPFLALGASSQPLYRATAPLTLTNNVFAIPQADGDTDGYLSSEDWQAFTDGSTPLTVGAFSASPQTNGATVTDEVITFGPASTTVPGMVSTGAQTWAGAKTFDSGALSSVSFTAPFFASSAANSAASGFARLASAQAISWRNNANNADLPLATNSSDQLTYNGNVLQSSSGLVPVSAGGTGIGSYATGDMLYASGTTTLAKLTIGAANTVQVSTGTAPSWSLLANANVASGAAIAVNKLAALTASRAAVSDGSGFLASATTTATQIGYLDTLSSNVQTQLDGKQATGNYITALTGDVSASGPGSASATVNQVGGYSAANVAAGATLANAATDANTASAIVRRNGSGNFTAGTITAALTGTASGNTTYTANQYGVVISGSGNAMTVIAPDASTSKVLTSGGSSAAPTWQDLPASGVTSVGLTMPNVFSVANSPITSSGDIAVTFATQTANTVFAGPTTGGAATPAFRSLVAADIPSLSGTYLPLVGGTMAGNIVMGGNSITGGLYYGSFISGSANPSSTGALRLASTDFIGFRNNANSADLTLSKNTSDTLLYDGPIFAVDNANVGSNVGYRANNTDNTNAASHARVYILAGGASGGDAFVRTSITGATDWAFGADNSDSDNWKISNSTVPGTNDRFVLNTAGPATFGGIIDTSRALKVGTGSSAAVSNGTAGVTQMGISAEITSTSGNTSLLTSFYAASTTLAASYTLGTRVGFYSDVATKGSGSTITRDVGYFVNQPSQGTNNASITDNNTFTGNYFIHSTSSSPSNLAGELDFSGSTGQNIRLLTNNAGDIGDTDGTNTFSNITGGTMVQFANSSTNYARLTNLTTNSPMLVLKSGSSNPIQLYAYTDGLLYLAFNGADRFTFSSSGNASATGGIAAGTYSTTGAFGNAMQTVVGTDGGTSTISANTGTFYLNPAGTLSTYTITMPAAPFNGMIVHITSSQVVTTLTVNANSGHTITAPLAAFTVGGFATWQFHNATSNWIRIG